MPKYQWLSLQSPTVFLFSFIARLHYTLLKVYYWKYQRFPLHRIVLCLKCNKSIALMIWNKQGNYPFFLFLKKSLAITYKKKYLTQFTYLSKPYPINIATSWKGTIFSPKQKIILVSFFETFNFPPFEKARSICWK